MESIKALSQRTREWIVDEVVPGPSRYDIERLLDALDKRTKALEQIRDNPSLSVMRRVVAQALEE